MWGTHLKSECRLKLIGVKIKKNTKKLPTIVDKIFPKFFLLSLIGFLSLLAISQFHFQKYFYQSKSKQLEQVAKLLSIRIIDYNASEMLGADDKKRLQQLIDESSQVTAQRITIISNDGTVLADSNSDSSSMDNHLARVEFQEALAKGVGQSLRFSETIGQKSLYVAIPIIKSDQQLGLIRTSFTTSDFYSVQLNYTLKIFWLSLILGSIISVFIYLTLKKISSVLLRLASLAESYSMQQFEDVIQFDDNETYEVNTLLTSLDEMRVRLRGLFFKIQQQRNEREVIFKSMSEGILSVYTDGNIFHWNKSVCRFFNIDSERNYKGMPFKDVIQNNQVKNIIDQLLKNKNHQTVEEEIVLNSGKILIVHATFLENQDATRMGILLVFTDVTRLKALEEHRKEFVANVSHELRTPLTSIRGYVENLIDSYRPTPNNQMDNELKVSFLQTINRNTKRLAQVIDDLLILSELDFENKSHALQKSYISVNSVIKQSLNALNDKAKSKNIKFIFENAQEITTLINGRLLEQAITNLVGNAIKFSPNNEQVIISLSKDAKMDEHNKSSASEMFTISIKDFGPGIDEVHQKRIFERFYSANKARSRELGGSGLGLSIVKNIAIAHNGEVKLESKLGQGCKFLISLPIINE